MQRIDALAERILQQIANSLCLSSEQLHFMKERLLPLLREPACKNKQELYGEVVHEVAQLDIKQYQIEPVLDILYHRYFSHYDLILECKQTEDERKKQLQTQSFEERNNERVIMDIEVPYQCKPLKEAKEIQTKRGISLDPTYLD